MAKKITTEEKVEIKAEEVLAPSVEETVVKKLNKKAAEKKVVAKAEAKKEEKTEKVESKTKTEKDEPANKNFFFGTGRRKTATARARLYLPTQEVVINGQKLEKGDVYVNGIQIEKYFNDAVAKAAYSEVYRTTNTMNRFITTLIVSGSGKTGQLGAVVLAIARALVTVDPKFKTTLRKKGFMTRDPRMKERKKPGLMGARKQKSSPKR